jgi:hypothetical protein
MTTTIAEVLHLSERYPTREALEAEVDFWDATTAGWYAGCPRLAQYSHRMGLTERDEALPLVTGIAIHAGKDVLYVSGDEDLALQAAVDAFGADRPPPPPGHRYAHLTVGFITAVFKNYLVWRQKHELFTPLVVHLDDLDLTNVVAAMWRVLPDERVILGESKLVMRFEVDGQELIYAGKPDLPVTLSKRVLVVDHKTSCGGYLSDWYFEKHVISNQLRCYCAMIATLLGRKVAGAYISGVYAGERALQERTKSGGKSSVTKFAPFGPLLFSHDQCQEALWNQYAWRELAFVHQELAAQHPNMYKRYGYPQNTGKSCQGCHYLDLCKTTPKARMGVIRQRYTQRQRQFLDL